MHLAIAKKIKLISRWKDSYLIFEEAPVEKLFEVLVKSEK